MGRSGTSFGSLSVTVRSGSVSVLMSYFRASRKVKSSGNSCRSALRVVSLISWSKISERKSRSTRPIEESRAFMLETSLPSLAASALLSERIFPLPNDLSLSASPLTRPARLSSESDAAFFRSIVMHSARLSRSTSFLAASPSAVSSALRSPQYSRQGLRTIRLTCTHCPSASSRSMNIGGSEFMPKTVTR